MQLCACGYTLGWGGCIALKPVNIDIIWLICHLAVLTALGQLGRVCMHSTLVMKLSQQGYNSLMAWQTRSHQRADIIGKST